MRRLTLVLALLLSFGLVACGGGNTATNDTGAEEAAQEAVENAGEAVEEAGEAAEDVVEDEPAEEEAEPAGMNEAVTVAEMTWTATAAADRGQMIESDNEFIEPLETQGRLVQVTFDISNDGSEQQNIETPDLVDSQGREFGTAESWYSHVADNETCQLESVNPGISKTCTWIYEVPADAEGLMAQVQGGNMFSPETAQITLDLAPPE